MIDVDRNLLPTKEDIQFYNQHGWFVSKVILSPGEIEAASNGLERIYTGQRDNEPPLQLAKYLHWSQDSPDGLRLNDFVMVRQADIRDYTDPVICPVFWRSEDA